jgi:hypothetical protein
MASFFGALDQPGIEILLEERLGVVLGKLGRQHDGDLADIDQGAGGLYARPGREHLGAGLAEGGKSAAVIVLVPAVQRGEFGFGFIES